MAQTGTVAEIVIQQEGTVVSDPVVRDLLETSVGQPLNMRDVRESITHLMSLNRYEDVQVYQEPVGGGIRLRYVLAPLHPIDRIEYRGALGVSEQQLREAVANRFGPGAVPARAEEIQRELQQFYTERGYTSAAISSRVEPTHAPDRASLVFDIDAGARARIADLQLQGVDASERQGLMTETPLRPGQPYDAPAIRAVLAAHEADLRSRGYYEARAGHFVTFDPSGGAQVSVSLERGPRISVAFTGDAIPESDRRRLVPIETEASVDEDLLEDASRAIEDYLRAGGYRDALVDYLREPAGDAVTITFRVSRGVRYVVDSVVVSGNEAMTTPEVLAAFDIDSGTPYVQEAIDRAVTTIRNGYRARGFTRPEIRVTPSPVAGPAAGERHVLLQVTIDEGPRTRIGAIAVEGNTVFSDEELREMMIAAPGRSFNEVEVATDRDRIELEYRNRGYDAVVVAPRVTLSEGDTRADVQLQITEGPQVFVDRVIVLGNRRTSGDTIRRELTLRPGEPLAYDDLLESQQRLAALGLFRRIQIVPLTHPGEARRDVIVQVEEAPPTTVGYGGGIEGGVRLRPTGDEGRAEERFELAPRGFFEVVRRNLFGKNRAVSLFTRVSLRSRDVIFTEGGVRLDTPGPGDGYGFNEYRVLGTFREPRVFNSGADVLVTGILDQAIRSSFNFRTREVRAEAGMRLSNQYSVAGRYSFKKTELFDERFTESEKPLIDRLFPQVRLSKLSTSIIRDTRDDVLYPNRGTFAVIDGELAARALGSEVGFVKTFVQGFAYLPLPTTRRTVLALGARLGAAHGFGLEGAVEAGGAANEDDVLLPASERFFGGGDTTVRGFSLDRLGDQRTISPAGFPTGGNGEVVLNAELRVSILNNRAEAVGFVDAGNIFRRASDLDLMNLRSAVGFGGRYRSPVGPIRVDLGFNLDRRELVPGVLERGYVLHISLGQAF